MRYVRPSISVGPPPDARPLDGGARDRVDRGDVVAVDVEAGHAVADRLVGERASPASGGRAAR